MLTISIVFLVGCGWVFRTLCFPNLNSVESTLVIFSDSRTRLSPDYGNTVEGFLDGQQWCTRRLAVLRIATTSKTQNLIILSGQQAPDEYRRLNVWLRQGAALLFEK